VFLHWHNIAATTKDLPAKDWQLLLPSKVHSNPTKFTYEVVIDPIN
jgi:hypothetical protein